MLQHSPGPLPCWGAAQIATQPARRLPVLLWLAHGSTLPNVQLSLPCWDSSQTDNTPHHHICETPCRHEPLTLLLLSEVLAGPRSRFQVYLQYLPQEYDILLLWTPEELQELQDPVLQAEVRPDSQPNTERVWSFGCPMLHHGAQGT